jgi:putative CocE/NonD family hydrolase
VYHPVVQGKYPVLLTRTPYGRSGRYSSFGHLQEFLAQRFAERGYAVVVQDVRGRFDSGGEFNPYWHEKEDGISTLEWIAAQPWCDGQIGMWGASYSGIVQWAAIPATRLVKAFVPSISASSLHPIIYPDGAFDLGLILRWLATFETLDRNLQRPPWSNLWFFLEVEDAVKRALMHLPLTEADAVAFGAEVAFYRFWLEHSDGGDDTWRRAFEHVRLDQVSAPAHLVGGWHDFFLRGLLEDYTKLKAAGQRPYLTIGPWHHFSALGSFADLREGLHWFDTHFKGKPTALRRDPVRLYIMGADEWRDLPDYPPPAKTHRFYLTPERWLSADAPLGDAPPSRYVYDPSRPTPILGGTQFNLGAGMRDNRPWEQRSDVLTFTSPPLSDDMEVIGEARLTLYVRSSLEHTDFFGRLCDVAPSGVSTNVCDGLLRVCPGVGECQPNGTLKIEVALWSTAYRFRKGHRLRLCIASGAHPRWSRNPGTGEPLTTSTELRIAEQQVFHDEHHPSALQLPVVDMKRDSIRHLQQQH